MDTQCEFVASQTECRAAAKDMQKRFEYSYALILPGFPLSRPNMLLSILPMLTLGTLLSIIALKILRRALLKPPAPSLE